MEKVRAIIVDDEQSSVSNLEMLLKTYCTEVAVLETGNSSTALEQILKRHEGLIDLVFLDVHLGDTFIFDYLKDRQNIPYDVVFISGHDYALRAFEYGAVNYFLKPVNVKDLIRVVQKTVYRKMQEQLLPVKEIKTQDSEKHLKKVILPKVQGYEIVPLEDIIYCKGDGSYVNFHLVDNKKVVVSKNIGFYEKILDDNTFIRSHKSYLANLSHIKEISKSDGNTLIMTNNHELPVTKNKLDLLLDRFQHIRFKN